MNLLKIDFNYYLPYVIDAFSTVYGEEYYSIISERIYNTPIIQYNDLDGFSSYILYLEECKRRELVIKFLDATGIDYKYNKERGFSEYLDGETFKTVKNFISPYWCFCSDKNRFSSSYNSFSPLLAFDSDFEYNPKEMLTNKLIVINYLLKDKNIKITEDNFDSFVKTEEYTKLEETINEYIKIFKNLIVEYDDFKKGFKSYEEYIEKEKKRKNTILEKYKKELVYDIYDLLPKVVRDALSEKTIENMIKIFIGNNNINYGTNFDCFSEEQVNILKSSDSNFFIRRVVAIEQLDFLKELGVISKEYRCHTEEEFNNYLSLIEQEEIKKYIPTSHIVASIDNIRKKKCEKAIVEYTITGEDYSTIIKGYENYPGVSQSILDIIRKGKTCVLCVNIFQRKLAVMFYPVKVGGNLFYSFMHECGHIIDVNLNYLGFEPQINNRCNPYTEEFRYYEKFNETINDIFTIEAVEVLRNQDLFLMEPKDITKKDNNNYNTSMITKELLTPLCTKFRNQVIKAKIKGNPFELINYIGKDNFEELVDIVNKVDYLCRNGLMLKLDNKEEDDIVLEYYAQKERTKQIYNNIDNYYESVKDCLEEYEKTNKKQMKRILV